MNVLAVRAHPDDIEVGAAEESKLYRLAQLADEFHGLACWCRYAEGFRWWRTSDRLVPGRLLS